MNEEEHEKSLMKLTTDLPYKIICTCDICGTKFKCGHRNCFHWQKKENGRCSCLSCYNPDKGIKYGLENHSCRHSIEPLTPKISRSKGTFIGSRKLQW